MFNKNHCLNHFDTNDIRAIIMPINSEIVYTWILALKHKLYNFALLSYVSYFAVITGIWQILSYLKFSIRKKIFSIFIFSSLASVVVEMSCLQTDMVVGALIISSFALFLKKNNFLSSLALSIALGVKTTAFVVLFPYLLMLFLINKKDFFCYLKYLVLNFILFSSYNYILNFIQFQNPITNQCAYLGHRFWGGIYGYIANIIHLSFQFFDFTGFTWGYYLNNQLFHLKDVLFNFINLNPELGSNVAQHQINITTDEQVIGFGILGFLCVIPAIFKGIFLKRKYIKLLSLSFILSFLILCAFMAYMEYSIRFVLTFVCILSPVFAILYNKKGLYKILVCLFCMFYMGVIPFFIRREPILRIVPNLIQNNFNMDKFINDCFNGKIIRVWGMTPPIRKTIQKRYKDVKKIGYFKLSTSSSLYLKEIFDIDFLTASKIDEYDLSKYDLLIFESEIQDDNIFKEADIQYKMDENSIRFLKPGLSCYYDGIFDNATDNKEYALRRWCFSVSHINKNKNFKRDYFFDYSDENIKKTRIYFYTKLN